MGNSRIEATFSRAKVEGRKVLVAYLCTGDPSAEESLQLAKTCVEAGADILELGVPFSDPSADGPAIARASERALRNGGSLMATLGVAARLRKSLETPIVLFGYYNPLYMHGDDEVTRLAKDAGVDAFLVVDLPVDESEGLRRAAHANGMGVIPLLAPTSAGPRIEKVRAAALEGTVPFVYYVSVTGVTGSTQVNAEQAGQAAAKLGLDVRAPVVVGFGIDGPERARRAAQECEGVVVGTAIVRCIEEGRTAEDRIAKVRTLVSAIREGLDAKC